MEQNRKKICLLGIVGVLVLSFYLSGLYKFLTLESIQGNLSYLQSQYHQNPTIFLALFLIIYILITSLSIPGSIILTLMSGAIFGIMPGTFYTTFSSTAGATIAFLMSRYIFQNSIKKKFDKKFSGFNSKFEEHGNAYLFILRIVPISPYVVVNVLMGLTNIRTINFFVMTFLGMFPGTYIYVLAGKKILEIKKPSDAISPEIILALCLLGLLPLILKLFTKPDKFIGHGGQ